MKILLLSAYHGPSHRAWADGLRNTLHEHIFELVTLPPRFFPWRSRGSALSWSSLELPENLDLVVATSILDLASLRGLHQQLSRYPTLVYFHENQFAYPRKERGSPFEEANFLITGIYTALAGDRLLFNSAFNRDTFLKGATSLLSKMPDHVPEGLLEELSKKSALLPVGLGDDLFRVNIKSERTGPLQVLWNHRWEHDKAPERFLEAMRRLSREGVPFRLSLLGQRFRNLPEKFQTFEADLKDHIDHLGWIADLQEYRTLLGAADLVVSTALHDFQGLSVQEGIAAGAIPVVPDRLVYPEYCPPHFRYPSFPSNPEREIEALVDHLRPLLTDALATREIHPPSLDHYRWSYLADEYRKTFQDLVRNF